MPTAYSLLRPFLFKLDPETAHKVSFIGMRWTARLHLNSLVFGKIPIAKPIKLWGLDFPNAVGLAAGLDKDGACINGLSALGFGFVELGTVTPRPQAGNPKPRLFRLPPAQALINRMGFNNQGVEALVERVKQVRKQHLKILIGINIGKNFDTSLEHATEDYVLGLRAVYAHADYVTINISSPNTPGLRSLQFGEELDNLLSRLKQTQASLRTEQQREVPLLVKIAPDMDNDALKALADQLLTHKIDGVIATNTTLARDAVTGLTHADEQGGLSGAPVKDRATHVVRILSKHLQGRMPIIAAGGILCAADAVEKIRAGASLVQIYSGLIYQGPTLIHDSIRAIAAMD
jgi:dihydroorotate dehydrogenase